MNTIITEKSNQKRNGMIDILRFCFSLIIVCHHSYMLTVPNTKPCVFYGGWIFTDFFFILSGMLMVDSVEKMKKTGEGWLIADIRFCTAAKSCFFG